MALDAVCLRALVNELRPQIMNLRIDKVQQPSRDQVILLLRGNLRLLLHAGGGSARVLLTERTRDNPAEPPMFCMLLRKYLVGARIAELRQPGLERIVELELDITDELGRPGKRTLVLEAMGRSANLILLDGERRIVSCIRRVDPESAPQRPVLPGLFYQYPPAQEKEIVTAVSEEAFFALLASKDQELRADEVLLDSYFGLSPLISRELVFRAAGDADARLFTLEDEKRRLLWKELCALNQAINENSFTPIGLVRDGRMFDFSYCPIAQYGGAAENQTFPSFSALLDEFHVSREQQERVRQRGAELLRTATTARDRLRRKLALQEKDYAATQDREKLRICGELITANLYRMERGQGRLTCENYYDENREIVIPLDPLLTPQQNAAKYFKKYNKAKTAEIYLREQMETARRDAEYLDSVLDELQRAETEQDFSEIRDELKETGFLRQKGKEKKAPRRRAGPRQFRTTAGFSVLVGGNNHQNDQLTRAALPRDIWLHTQKLHGSHVILQTQGREVDAESIAEAAKLAAWYSKARNSANVPVDYTAAKNVKKPSGARPGMVVYTTHHTVTVSPDEDTVKRLSVK